MISPLTTIKQGIIDGNWEDVVVGYNALTSSELSIPETPQINIDFGEGSNYEVFANSVRDLLNTLIDKNEVVETLPKAIKKAGRPKKVQEKESKINKPTVVAKVETSTTNLFDPKKYANESSVKKAAEDDKVLLKGKIPTERVTRPEYKDYTVKATCNECEKKYNTTQMEVDALIKEESPLLCHKCIKDKAS